MTAETVSPQTEEIRSDAAEQTELDFKPPGLEVKVNFIPSARDEIGVCDRCRGPNGATSYGVRVGGKVLLVCARCDRDVRR